MVEDDNVINANDDDDDNAIFSSRVKYDELYVVMVVRLESHTSKLFRDGRQARGDTIGATIVSQMSSCRTNKN